MSKKISAVAQVKQVLDTMVDSVSRLKNGAVRVRRGYFYRSGDCDMFAENISRALTNASVIHRVEDRGDVWKEFRGGASVANQSHFYVDVTIF